MILRVILISLSLMLAACSTSIITINNDYVLKNDQGLFLTKLRSNYPFKIALKNSSGNTIWLEKNPLIKNSQLLAVNLPAGKYSIHKISWENKDVTYSKLGSYEFLIRDGKVNYICDLGVKFKIKKKNSLATGTDSDLNLVLPMYLKASTYKEFKNNYPKLLKKHPFVSSPVSMCVRGKSKNAVRFLSSLN